MDIKVLEDQIAFKVINFPKVFGEEVDHITATFDLDSIIDLPGYSNFSPKRKVEFIAGRIAALKAIQKTMDFKEIIPIGIGGMPSWPVGITGSISHSSNTVSVATIKSNLNFRIGLDLEYFFDEATAQNLQSRILLKSEKKFSHPQIITLIYSVKESIFKSVSILLDTFLDFHDIEVTALNFPLGVFEARLINYKQTPKLKGNFTIFEGKVLTGLKIILN